MQRRGRHDYLTDAEWEDMKARYVSDTSTTIESLAREYNLSPGCVGKRSSAGHWVQLRRDMLDRSTRRALSQAEDERTDQLCKLLRVSDKLDEILDKLTAQLEEKPGLLLADLRGISDLAKAARTAVTIKRDLHGLPTVQQKEALEINRERLRIAKEAAEREKAADAADRDVHIVIEGGEGLDG